MRPVVHFARLISDILALGLYVQYGCQRGRGRRPKHTVELVQRHKVSEAEEVMGGMAGVDSSVDCHGNGLGAARLPADMGDTGCAQPVALRYCGTNDMVVQVCQLFRV